MQDNPQSDAAPTSTYWYQTGWAWFWLIFFWPAGFYAFWMRGGEGRFWVTCILGIIALAAIFGDPNAEVSSLSESRAEKACKTSWLDSSVMANGNIDYEQTLSAKTGQNKFNVLIHYTANGVSRSYPCDVFLRDGKVIITTY